MPHISTVGQLKRALAKYRDSDEVSVIDNDEEKLLMLVERKKSDNIKFLQFKAVLTIGKKTL